MDLKAFVRDVPDFPKPGIMFKDITPLLQDPLALRYAIDQLAVFGATRRPDVVLGAEARGFILGAALAYALGAGFVPARKPGKLPWRVSQADYALEYGVDSLQMHQDAIRPAQRVLVHDDLLATGGTARAKIELVEAAGGVVVGVAFLIELAFLGGRDKLKDYDVLSLMSF
jgi:adenine phosphoribosyltransferase